MPKNNSTNVRRSILTVDSHTEGNPTRVIVGGVAIPPGDTLLEKQQWLVKKDDNLRRLLCSEPRGGGLMCSVFVMPSITRESDFSVIIMEQDAYVPMSGHCIIGTATTVVEMGMVPMVPPITTVKFDTVAGQVTCFVEVENNQVTAVSFDNVDSFLHKADASINVEDIGHISVDIAYGGDYYTIVNADKLKISLSPNNDAELIAASVVIREAVAEQLEIVHPEQPHINQCYMVLFTSSLTNTGDFKQTILAPPGAIDRSPCGTGTSARLAMMYSNGGIALNEMRTFEGILGTCFEGQVVGAEVRNDVTYIIPRVKGRAYITGYHQFVLSEQDPFPAGFRLGPALGERPK